jgi:hypothetical protein
MSEISKMFRRAKVNLGGELLTNKIKFDTDLHPNSFLEGFKAGDKNHEAWTGYHAPNLLIILTEGRHPNWCIFNVIDIGFSICNWLDS